MATNAGVGVATGGGVGVAAGTGVAAATGADAGGLEHEQINTTQIATSIAFIISSFRIEA